MRFIGVVLILMMSCGCNALPQGEKLPPIKTKPRQFVPYPKTLREQIRHRRMIKDRARQIAAENGRDLDAENRARTLRAIAPFKNLSIFGPSFE